MKIWVASGWGTRDRVKQSYYNLFLILFLLASLTLGRSAVAGDVEISVDLRTDYNPGVDFTAVQTTISGTREIIRNVQGIDDYIHGVRIAEYSLPPGSYDIQINLLSTEGTALPEAYHEIPILLSDRDWAFTAVIARPPPETMDPGLIIGPEAPGVEMDPSNFIATTPLLPGSVDETTSPLPGETPNRPEAEAADEPPSLEPFAPEENTADQTGLGETAGGPATQNVSGSLQGGGLACSLISNQHDSKTDYLFIVLSFWAFPALIMGRFCRPAPSISYDDRAKQPGAFN